MKNIKLILLRIWDVYFIGILVVLMLAGYLFYGIMSVILKLKRIFYLFLFLLVVSGIAGGVFVYRVFWPKPAEISSTVTITVRNGMNARIVSKILEQNNLIRNEKEFLVISKWFGLDKKLKSGRYRFCMGASLMDILRLLGRGSANYDNVTIQEGLTAEQIASKLDEYCGIDSAKFMFYVNDKEFINNFGIEANSLEGYLFPETYQFAWATPATDAVNVMVGKFQKTYKDLEKYKSPKVRKYSCHQIVTIASIVEKETSIDIERPLVAQVFLNRLRIGMGLGADPTVRFILKKFTGPLRVSDLNIESPYNTRRFRGLPPGPICSPGYKSLEAVLNPQETSDLYFVAKADGTNEHYFSKTYIEHINAKLKAENERKKRRETS